ncbi:MAG: prepilin-type N-terminal cleavage/methylation domain-containing protein [Thermoanaerobaculales bacterium]|jgi:general secretion pathway protein G|nr:prepilin-type N-terminal cleavage/methylation domain-containing protein [Thermoanaerobaculales bacterium]
MRRQKGFTLIELLIVVAIIGIIAAIAIPNLLNAINRSRQKRTMADMRTIGTAAEAYAVDWSFYPNTGNTAEPIDTTWNAIISPIYVKKTPNRDGWRESFRVQSESRFYSVGSSARDKLWESGGNLDAVSYVRDPTADMDCDIIYSQGTFISYPEGVQTD